MENEPTRDHYKIVLFARLLKKDSTLKIHELVKKLLIRMISLSPENLSPRARQ